MSIKLVVLASGRGSNFEAIASAIKAGQLDAEVSLVLSDKVDAKVLDSAREKGIEAKAIDSKAFASKEAYEEKLLEEINGVSYDLVILAGYMKVLGKTVLSGVKTPIMNIHPSLLPSFPGLHAQKQALDYGVKYSGCTVHFVDAGLDSGPIIAQRVVEVLDNDTEESLASRILKEEHKLYSEVIALFEKNKLEIVDRKVIVKK